jgi:hypothetical protein
MPRYILSYRTAKSYGAPASPDDVALWTTFLNEHIEPHVVDPGYPVREASRVLGETGESTRIVGYSIVTADDFEAALRIAEHCPTLRQGGGVEVGALVLPPPEHPLEQIRSRPS